ncbi:MAG TPA: flagellar hook-associated protein FlgL [Symbiobacteriaceae bacterium]|nr:flagellar hook-associated protein FlgL [Symbiobacteriaceae bacterium]
MRVTNRMMAASSLYNVNQLKARTATLTEQVSSGDRFTRVSEDPSAGAEVMRIQHRSRAVEQWKSNLNNSKSWVYATEAKLGDITDLLNQAKELALTASNGTISEETRKALAPTAENLLKDLMAALNESEPDGAMFGGFKTEIQAFSLDDVMGTVTYNGDSGVMTRDVGPGVTLDVNIPGNRLVDDSDPNNMVRLLWELKTALETPANSASMDPTWVDSNGDLYVDENVDGDSVIDAPSSTSKLMPQAETSLVNRISALVPKLDTVRQTVIGLRSEMGSRQVRIQALDARMTDTETNLADALQQAQGVDMTKAIMELNNADVAYRAALQVSAKILPQSLADFLR